jgi:GxxExxY protein
MFLPNDATRGIIDEFYYVYNKLGFGFLELHFSMAMERRLRRAGREVAREFAALVMFDGEELGFHRLDMVVDHAIVVEIKSTEHLHPQARRQLMNYLRATNLRVGVLLHFGRDPRFYRVFNTRAS